MEMKMAVSIEFQKRITDLVAESNTKKSELPALIGIDYISLSNAINYGIVPTPRILIRMANFFNVSINYLLGRSDDDKFSKSSTNVSFKDRLNSLCSEKGVTVYKVSQACFIERSYFSKWINNDYFPSLEMLDILCDYFDVSIDYILGRTDDK